MKDRDTVLNGLHQKFSTPAKTCWKITKWYFNDTANRQQRFLHLNKSHLLPQLLQQIDPLLLSYINQRNPLFNDFGKYT